MKWCNLQKKSANSIHAFAWKLTTRVNSRFALLFSQSRNDQKCSFLQWKRGKNIVQNKWKEVFDSISQETQLKRRVEIFLKVRHIIAFRLKLFNQSSNVFFVQLYKALWGKNIAFCLWDQFEAVFYELRFHWNYKRFYW